ncbi:MAG: histidinol-phosphate transaminase [Opitutales bacterium]|nr:histidinol-phosphate transaminase [Opitutales bacterium]
MSATDGSPADYARTHIARLHPYVPGEQPDDGNWIKLNTNELPYPCSRDVGPAIAAEVERLPLYPSPRSMPLRRALAEHHGVDPAQVIVGNGSDDILNLLTRVFCGTDGDAVMAFPGYSLYPVITAIRGAETHRVRFGEDMRLPVDALAAAKPRILFLTTPNAPTGVGFANDEIARLLDAVPGIVVADEAYADFAESTAADLLGRYPRLVVTRTFSKSYGLAGLRVGYALAHAETVDLLDRVRDSYNVNRLSQAGALAALRDQAYFRETVARVKATRARFSAELEERGWFTYPSSANFVFTRPRAADGREGPETAEALFRFLREHRVLVRHFPSDPLTAPFLRISIGTDAQMTSLSQIIDQWQTTD